MSPWESPGGGSGRNDAGLPQQFAQQSANYDSSDRPPSSWNSPGGGDGGGGGSGGYYMGGRRYYDDFRGDVGEERLERGGRGGEAGDWQELPPRGGGGGAGVDAFRERERLEMPPFGRHQHQAMERPVAGGGEEQRGTEMLLGSPPAGVAAAAARDERDRQQHQMFVRGGADRAYERSVGRAGWPGGGGADRVDSHYQRGRQESTRPEWEVRGGGGSGGGGGGGAPFQWEESARGEGFPSTNFDPSAQQEAQRRELESGRVVPASSLSMGALHASHSSQAEEEQNEGRRIRPVGSPGEGQQR